jgi:hypothetical protein
VVAALTLPLCLSEIRRDACRRCAEEDAGTGCDTQASLPRLVESLRAGKRGVVADYLKRHKARVCADCAMLLLLHGIAANIPAGEIPDWLDRPNDDLAGRTPRERINAGDYDPVFEAVWLRGQPGPVS